MKIRNDEKEKILVVLCFSVFFFILYNGMTRASLWLDEGVEYWFSKSIHAIIPGESTISTMYERILRTFQPPLYNIIMYIWLKISDTERWFRFFGVVMGLGSGIAVYKSIKRVSNYKFALSVLFFLGGIYQFVYYIQECAEYNLMLFNIFWAIFWFIVCIQDYSHQNILLFVFFCVMSVYSQYGAVFFVLAFATVLAVNYFFVNRKHFMFILSTYIIAGTVCGLPLYFFFAQKQIQHIMENSAISKFSGIDGSIVNFFMSGVSTILKYNFLSDMGTGVRKIFTVFIFLLVFFTFYIIVKQKSKVVVLLLGAVMFEYLLYFIMVYFKWYGYGYFGNRYSLFFLPSFIILGGTVISRFIIDIYFDSRENSKILKYRPIIIGLLLGFAVIYCVEGYKSINNGWSKEDNKGMLKAWYTTTPNDCETVVYYGAVPAFSVYLEHEEEYIPSEMLNCNKRNVILQEEIRNKSLEEYTIYFNNIYSNGLPNQFYFVCSHYIYDDLSTMTKAVEAMGYHSEVIWEGTGAKIICFSKIED